MAKPTRIVPDKGVISCYNGTGTDLAANVMVMTSSGGARYVKLPSGTTVALYGATMDGGIPNGEWGDVQVDGVALVKAGGALATTGIQCMAKTDGKLQAYSAAAGVNAAPAGQLRNTAAAEDDLCELDLRGCGTIQQGA